MSLVEGCSQQSKGIVSRIPVSVMRERKGKRSDLVGERDVAQERGGKRQLLLSFYLGSVSASVNVYCAYLVMDMKIADRFRHGFTAIENTLAIVWGSDHACSSCIEDARSQA